MAGFARAQNNLGLYYKKGSGCKVDIYTWGLFPLCCLIKKLMLVDSLCDRWMMPKLTGLTAVVWLCFPVSHDGSSSEVGSPSGCRDTDRRVWPRWWLVEGGEGE